MKRVTVHASRTYDVLVGRGLLDEMGQQCSRAVQPGGHVLLVSETNVAALYLERAQKSLRDAGFAVDTFVFPAGEASKNLDTFGKLLSRMAQVHLTRSDFALALGGGVVGDLTGFAASVYARGIRFVQVPTTLLAMVDASVGGKTAVDLPEGKNLAGTFWQPSLVLCDLDLLDTLPDGVYRSGMAEVIKYALIRDRELYERLCNPHPEQLEWIVARCIQDKRDLVDADERDTGDRQFLNLGHTIGHAIEKCSDYQVSHGEAVAIGLHAIARAAARRGLCPPAVPQSFDAILSRYDLPLFCGFSAGELTRAALQDKKRAGDRLTLVVPVDLCRCILHPVPVEEIGDWIADGCGADAEGV